jgi:hypothetical protein
MKRSLRRFSAYGGGEEEKSDEDEVFRVNGGGCKWRMDEWMNG